MFRVVDSVDTGKTRKLLEECAKNHGVFVCKHPERIEEKCKAYGIDVSNIGVITGYNEYKATLVGVSSTDESLVSKVYIDDLEDFIDFIVNDKLSGYSLTIED